MVERGPLVLDADGVFLDERPYWDAAIAVALAAAGIERTAGQHAAVTAIACDRVGLPQVAKERGCNSNWDLAAVLVRALADAAVTASLRAGRFEAAVVAWATAARALRGEPLAADPLARFGLMRDAAYDSIAERCEQELSRCVARSGWPTLGPAAAMRTTLAALRAAGWQLGVCTGRGAEDLDAALQQNGLVDAIAGGPRCDADLVDEARQRFGVWCTGKPGPFPLLAAVLGAPAAAAVLRLDARDGWPAGVVYVGDSRADFAMAQAVQALGFPLRYAHVASPATDAGTLAALASDASVFGVFPSLAAFAAQLQAAVA